MAYKEIKKEHAFQTFNKLLREEDFPSVIFMYGEEDYLIEWACNALADKLVDKSMQAMDFVKTTEEDTADDLLNFCNTFSIMSPHRVVWAKDFNPLMKKSCKGFGEKELKAIMDYALDPNPSTVLIFSCNEPEASSELVKFLKKNVAVYEFNQLDRGQLSAFAEKRFKAAGLNIDKSTLKYLIDETGYFFKESEYKIFNLENDIKKIIALSDGKAVTEDVIDATVHGDMDTFVFDFLDAAMSSKKDVAIRMLGNMLGSGSEVYSVLGILVNQFELMLMAKQIYERETRNRDKVAEVLKMNAYRVKKALSAADKFSETKLKELLIQLYEIDRNIKTGAIDGNLALELFVGRI
jgi:DNA polymerase-3 subunit delta